MTVTQLLGGMEEGRVRGVARLRRRLVSTSNSQHQLQPPLRKPQADKVVEGEKGSRVVGLHIEGGTETPQLDYPPLRIR